MVEDTSLCFNAYKGLPGKLWLPTHLPFIVRCSIRATDPTTNHAFGFNCSKCMLCNRATHNILCQNTDACLSLRDYLVHCCGRINTLLCLACRPIHKVVPWQSRSGRPVEDAR